MANNSRIEWTDASWNPVLGCSKVSPGCQNCYAVQQSFRNEAMHSPAYVGLTVKHPNGLRDWSGKVVCLEDRLEIPLRWKRPRRIFVNSMFDLFHEKVDIKFIANVWAVMAICKRLPANRNAKTFEDAMQWYQHTFQVLTKRPERARQILNDPSFSKLVCDSIERNPMSTDGMWESYYTEAWEWFENTPDKPLPNVWLGTSVENQATADERIPHLLKTPAAVRWLSCEPLLGSVDLSPFLRSRGKGLGDRGLHWIVCGGESGPNARPMHPDWARSLRDQCQTANVPFFFKQWGEFTPYVHVVDASTTPAREVVREFTGGGMQRVGKARAGRLLDGQQHNEYPA